MTWDVNEADVVTTYVDGIYINHNDLRLKFGDENITRWSNLDNDDTSTNVDKIDQAIAYAEELIHSRFLDSQYALPMLNTNGSTPLLVKDWAVVFAGAWLYFCRGQMDEDEEGNKLTATKKEAEDQINNVLAGQMSLDVVKNDTRRPSAPSVVL